MDRHLIVSVHFPLPDTADNGISLAPIRCSTKEAAEFLALSPRTLEGMRSDGTGPLFAKLGDGPKAKVVYRRADLKEWVASRVCTPHPKTDDDFHFHTAT